MRRAERMGVGAGAWLKKPHVCVWSEVWAMLLVVLVRRRMTASGVVVVVVNSLPMWSFPLPSLFPRTLSFLPRH